MTTNDDYILDCMLAGIVYGEGVFLTTCSGAASASSNRGAANDTNCNPSFGLDF